jgi:hypothetical protein
MNSVIYDFETLSQDMVNGVAVSLAVLQYDEKRFLTNPYEYEELLDDSHMIRFDVAEQIELGRTIQKSTLDWWKNQPKEAQALLKPSPLDKSIKELYNWFCDKIDVEPVRKVWTRGNSFDPIFLRTLLAHSDEKDPFDWWLIRDTRSFIEGLSYGSPLKNTFVPEELADKFVGHDPRHDIVMDVMRMQKLINIVAGE